MGSPWRQLRIQLGLAFIAGLVLLLPTDAPRAAQDAALGPPDPEFRFVRLAYADNPNRGFGGFGGFGRGRRGGGFGGSWTIDAPEAEEHFMRGLARLTRVATRHEFLGVQPQDDALFEHPFIYAVEVGRWYLDEADAARLREYLLRGGFLVVDDFHGTAQWASFMESMRRVFPDREVVDIPDDHEVFHVLYDLDHKVQIPGVAALGRGRTWESDGVEPYWRGIFDDDGRLMVAINFNMDLGDAWEHADDPRYPQPLTALAYRFGINYVLYAMSH